MKLRAQLLTAFLIVVSLSGIGMTVATNYYFILEREAGLYDLAASLLPEISGNLNQDLLAIHDQVQNRLRTNTATPNPKMEKAILGFVFLAGGEIRKRSFADVLNERLPLPHISKEFPMALYPSERSDSQQLWLYSRNLKQEELFILLSAAELSSLREPNRNLRLQLVTNENRVLARASDSSGVETPLSFKIDPAAPRVVVVNKVPSQRLEAFLRLESFPNSAIVGFMPISRILDRTLASLQDSLGLIGFIFFAALSLAYVLSKNIAKPIEELQAATSRIAQGERVEIRPRSRNELGRLTRAFNKMSQELIERENQVRETLDQLAKSERLASLGQLSAGIAHEVKNPLNSILGLAQLWARKHKDADADSQESMSLILNETKRASRILTDLLTFAREKQPQLKRENLISLLDQFLLTQSPQAATRGIRLRLVAQKSEIFADIDQDQIFQVLANLVTNAFHAVESASQKDVTITVEQEGSSVARILVRDTGSGIAETDMKKIFEPFFSTKKLGQGTGLGLAICYGIIQSHGAEIRVQSKVGAGTEFEIRIPLSSALKLPKTSA